MKPEQTILVNLSGRGDKDVQSVSDRMEVEDAAPLDPDAPMGSEKLR